VAADDHARIKQCMNDLVALGDEAVAALLDIVASGKDETALWAAEALARIGTPVATTALLDTLELVKEGAYKEQLAKRVSSISNHDSWPILLDAVQDTRDPAVQRAAAASLSRMADTAVVDELVARYDAALTKEEADRLAQIVSNIDSPAASDALRSLAGDIMTMPQDSLQQAAIDALANIADPQSLSYLLQKLEASAPGEGSYLFNTISHIDQPQAQSSLLYAAAGNKEVSAEQGRTAAIYALENYPSEETCRLLEQIIAREENMAVTTAALRTLENIEKKQPAVLEKATSKADTTDLLSTHPLQK
jgi:HEAT repeat protein